MDLKKREANIRRRSVNMSIYTHIGPPRWLSGKEFTCEFRSQRRLRFDPWIKKLPWWRAGQPTSVFLPGESHGQRSLAGYSPWDHKELCTTEACTQREKHNKYSQTYFYFYSKKSYAF